MRTEIRHSFLTMFIVLIQATLASAQFIRQPATTSLEVENRTLDGLLVSSDFASSVGGTVVARYSTYSVIRVPQTALAAVNNAATAKHIVFRQRDDFDRIYLASRVVDTLNEPSPNPAVADYPSATHGLYVLQFMAPLQPAWRSDVEKAGARLLGYLPNNAYLVDATPETAALLRKVSSVQWLNPLSPKDKNQEFTSVTTADADLWVDIADMPGADQVLRMIAARNVGETFQSTEPNRTRVRCRLTLADASAILEQPSVIGISLTPHDRLSNERGALGLTANVDSLGRQINPGTYSTWLTSRCSYCGNLHAEGFMVGIADTGLDGGPFGAIHPDLAGRVQFGANFTTDAAYDFIGHGTLVAGNAAGNASQLTTDADGFYMGMGIAPTAGIFATKIISYLGIANPDIYSWASDARFALPTNVFFQNHSHNQYTQTAPFYGGQYTSQSRTFDIAVRDANANAIDGMQPITLTVSAGNQYQENSGDPGYRQVMPPATAKNVIAVGAAETYFAQLPSTPNNPTACPPRSGADSVFNAASFSTHGTNVSLIPDGYSWPFAWSTVMKPDLMAPSTIAISTRSSRDNPNNWCYEPLPTGSAYPDYAADSGTSFAAPIAEAAALLASRVYSEAVSSAQPNAGLASPALIKAMLIGSARTMEGGLEKNYNVPPPYPTIGARPNIVQGFGRINLEDLFSGTTKQYINQTRVFHSPTDAPWNATYYASDPSQPVKIALVWTDAPGDVESPPPPFPATSPLVNDLNLNVETPFYLNGYSPCWRWTPGNNPAAGDQSQTVPCIGSTYGIGSDYVNNEEIALFQPLNGSLAFNRFIVNVTPHTINGRADPSVGDSNQDFALYVFNGRTRGDIDADGATDILWRNKSTGEQFVWLMNGTAPIGASLPPGPTGTVLGGVGDFDHNGSDDIAYQDPATGLVSIMLLNRTSQISTVAVGTPADPNWKLRAVGDLNNDDNMDLIFRYEGPGPNLGMNMVWLMNGTSKRSEVMLTAVPDLSWSIAAVADMDGDGRTSSGETT